MPTIGKYSISKHYVMPSHNGVQVILKLHFNIEKVQPIKCDDCGKAFSQKYSLNEHTESVQERKQPFNCNDCGEAFSYKHTLNIESVHEGKKLLI
mgnify:FL=1